MDSNMATRSSILENPQRYRSLVGYSPWGHRVRHDWATKHWLDSNTQKAPNLTLPVTCVQLRESVLVTQSYLTLGDPMDCSPPGSSVHEILQARILKPVAIPFSRGSSWPKDQNQVSYIADRLFYCLSQQGSSLQKVLIFEKECCSVLINLERKRLTPLTYIEHLRHVDIMPRTSLSFLKIN